ncbi:MAG: hypothetical protein KGH61_04680 [Candidatus Micrarchaeota archaeon]|nr:hypothetical protein [Candidatus Micrarchaeota archaeon]MDE1848213.1 hypothetical protein [Candidatus Micrarchaeota archaeon]MDE1864861.1 hypothetical protein [Candidatus Micrarchaeota archaeon]
MAKVTAKVASSAANSGSMLNWIGILILAIVVFGGLLIVAGNLISAPTQLPYFADTNAPVPAVFTSAIGQQGQLTAQNIAQLAGSHLSNSSQFKATYSGALYVKPSGVLGYISTINSPIQVNESKYLGNLKFSVDASSLPILGDGKVYYIGQPNATYVCLNLNQSAISSGNAGAVLLGSRNVTCSKSGSLAGLNMSELTTFNLALLSQFGMQLSYQSPYQSTYNGQGCTFVYGSMSQPQSNGTGQFQMCISDIYYLPLSIGITLQSSQIKASIMLNETSIGNNTLESGTVLLPGPVVG